MPCPPDAPISGQGRITTYAAGSQAAEAQAVAVVPAAAMLEAFKATNCPADCRFANPYGVRYRVTGVGSSFSLWNIFPFFGLTILVGQTIYQGIAEYTWSGTARCVNNSEGVLHTIATPL